LDNAQDITVLLHRWHAGDQAAGDEIFRRVMPELQKIAERLRGRERRNFSLQRTELVNELYTKLLAANHAIDWRDRSHFFAIFNIKLRRFLIDRARAKPTAELSSIEDLPEGILAGHTRLEVRLAVDQLLDELEKESSTRCGIVVARIYFGYTVKEITENCGLPQRTVERHLHDGRRWLFERLKPAKPIE
jgi:RNA polymerase sigma factor (TIGR02999 family)